ncbi:MAG: type I-E CRISPR-associated protein Cas6/Cse3/CasE, partial [Gemmatimonadaceae bacterium]|nr:type I-E CRISPR-associated protein Cas6/Cse3/CasE [Gemmatimonadaceae bacterium]
MTLHMLALHPDVGRLMRFASRERLLPPGGDLGYACHAVLVGAFGVNAPKPFAWCAPGTRAGGRDGRLLAYARVGLPELASSAASFADPELAAILALESGASKEMPSQFAPGTRLGFRVRIRPVVRTGKDRDGTGARERDAHDRTATDT